MIHSDNARHGAQKELKSIRLSTYGIIFLGTPHQGGNSVMLAQRLLSIVSIFANANKNILKHLERDSEYLQQQLGQYAPISGDFVTKFAYEIYETPVAIGKKIMVFSLELRSTYYVLMPSRSSQRLPQSSLDHLIQSPLASMRTIPRWSNTARLRTQDMRRYRNTYS